jgi:NAD(P)-dependent dehydrogenase (short-subunit alcohol dehydrogenase family)
VSQTLKNQVAIISGGLGDIGRAIALELAGRGADIAIGDVRAADEAGMGEMLQSLRALGVRARYDRVDVADAVAVERWIAAVESDLGPATLIIPNAAIVTRAGIRDVTPTQWSRELRINLDGAFHLAQGGAKRLLQLQRPGRIVFIGSWAAHAPHPAIAAYCAAKAGLRMLCKCMALDLAPDGILVNEVAPGYVDAGLSAQGWATNPDARRRAAQRVPIGKLIDAAEVAQQVAHLCEPANRHMTGSVLLMDGGLSLVTPAAGVERKVERKNVDSG